MKRLLLVLILSLPLVGYAQEDALNQTLVRVINQINAIMPLLDEAQTEIEPNTRIQLHIEHFEGSDGKTHAGLRTDLLTIRNALIDYINKRALSPKTIKPLALDFIGK
ncbi:TPA: hypothetical protein JBF42_02285 [Legionella pneumophila]|uniref:hypothetical protein n=1 Tax=Legionella pneumophila TaxID=446 RepID=UPI000CEB047B|nr:hypothetical protein [Legionella pneumophila]PPK32509.1 hypothetical protein C3927_09785 [Legionella pneumophila]HAT2073478.1 hypothetical protein [Legionella pneumophila]HAU0283130.1 hypothetical protein [Legionella pneumophila]HAU0306413.1 hypothetical protein [Legionella pneumophila]